MFDAFHGEFTFINCLSIAAFFTTVGLFFCGIPICRQIWKRRDTTEISGAPFLMGVLGGTCWCVYGYLKGDHTVMLVTGAQIVLYSTYTVFYWFMTKNKLMITIKVVALIITCAALVAAVVIFQKKVFHPLGIICMTLNTADFAAPLAGLNTVIRRGATSTLPLPLCIANFMVSTEWFIYGLLVWDFYLITPNGIGSFLAFCQVMLFVVLPRKPDQRAPILRLISFVRNSCCSCCAENTMDLESAAVVTADKKSSAIDTIGIHRMSSRMSNKHRWSSRMITNVVGEMENVIQKVHGDQFGYKLNKEDEEGNSTDSGTLTPVDEKPTKATPAVAVTLASGISTSVQPVQYQQSGAPAMTSPTPVEPEVQLNMFEQSARSIGARLITELTQRGRGFALSHGSNSAKMEDEEQFDINMDNEDDDEDVEEEEEAQNGVQYDGQQQSDEDEDGGSTGPEKFFGLSYRGQNDRLKQRKKQKSGKKGTFGCSLQAGHFRAMRRHAQQQTTNGDGLPTIDELSTQQQQQQIKRAASAPNIFDNEQQQQAFAAAFCQK
ncbi:hypothetical protein niasHT_013239 [Heterodera trifolii]|uniref:Sugar transporter SWEET1 n=1 Tax=Heterodera trifolii TaxID=157864 RepID=A0ABD2KYD4_9BILA